MYTLDKIIFTKYQSYLFLISKPMVKGSLEFDHYLLREAPVCVPTYNLKIDGQTNQWAYKEKL